MNTPSSQKNFFQAGGTLDPDSPSYIEREADNELWDWIMAAEYCHVLTARQMGKSSLIVRAQRRLQKQGVRSALIDLNSIGSEGVTAEQWYYTLISETRRLLNLEIDEHSWWVERSPFSPVQRFTEFLDQVVLTQVQEQVVIFVDEIDSTLSQPFTDDFFIAIRAMYNKRANNPAYRRLSFVLVGVAHPQDLIKNRRRTPYNIGQTVDLKDFSAQNAASLLPGLDSMYPRQAERILEQILYWTAGQPYLTQRLCLEVVKRGGESWPDEQIDRLVEQLFFRKEQIRTETHLQRIDEYVRGKEDHNDQEIRQEILSIYRDVLAGKRIEDEERSIVKSRLRLSGLLKVTPEGYLQVRNRIYEHVFGPEWAGVSPPEPVQPQPGLSPLEPERDQTRSDDRPTQPKRWMWAWATLVLLALVSGTIWMRTGFPAMLGPKATTDTPTSISTRPPTRIAASTPSPSPTPSATATHQATATWTPEPTSTPTLAPTSTPTEPPTATPTATRTLSPAPTSTPAPTPYVVVNRDVINLRKGPGEIYDRAGWAQKGDRFALLARTEDSTWWQIAYRDKTVWVIGALVDVHQQGQRIRVEYSIPSTPTPTPTPTPLPAPVLIEPLEGDSFAYKATIRFKFTWYRGLEPHERVSIYLKSTDGPGEFDWWASEDDILGGGGVIRETQEGYLFEINSGMGNLPPGDAMWRVAIFADTPPDLRQISPWSQERRITRQQK